MSLIITSLLVKIQKFRANLARCGWVSVLLLVVLSLSATGARADYYDDEEDEDEDDYGDWGDNGGGQGGGESGGGGGTLPEGTTQLMEVINVTATPFSVAVSAERAALWISAMQDMGYTSIGIHEENGYYVIVNPRTGRTIFASWGYVWIFSNRPIFRPVA